MDGPAAGGAWQVWARYGNSFGQSERNRARWTQNPGDAGQGRPQGGRRLPVVRGRRRFLNSAAPQPTSRASTAEVFQQIGLDFGILYDAERNAGNDVRRVGQEGLFDMLARGRNAAALGRRTFKAIVTTDPTLLATRRRTSTPLEAIGGRPVPHYTELLNHMLHVQAALQLQPPAGPDWSPAATTCDLGVVTAACTTRRRRLILATGCRFDGDAALRLIGRACCGAGGGRIWMEEKDVKERPERGARPRGGRRGTACRHLDSWPVPRHVDDAPSTPSRPPGWENRLAVEGSSSNWCMWRRNLTAGERLRACRPTLGLEPDRPV